MSDCKQQHRMGVALSQTVRPTVLGHKEKPQMKNIIRLAIIGCTIEVIYRLAIPLHNIALNHGWFNVTALLDSIDDILRLLFTLAPVTLLVFFITLLKRQK